MTHKRWLVLVVNVVLVLTPKTFADQLPDVFGAWDLTLQTRNGPRPSWVKLLQEDKVAVAEFVGTSGGKSRADSVAVDDHEFEWTLGPTKYHATLNDGTLTGTAQQGDRRTPFTGKRVIRPTNVNGTWDVQLDIGGRTMQRVVTLNRQDDHITGRYAGGPFGERPLKNVNLNHNRLTFTVEVANEDRNFTVNYDVELRGDQFAGTVAVQGSDWRAHVKATRQRNWNEPIELIGNDLSNWTFQQAGGDNQWKVIDGVLVNEERGWNIVTNRKFKDYKLRVDVRVPAHGNSGIYLNGRYEVQVADSYGEDVSEGGMGAIYGRAVPTANPSRPADEWQTFEIRFVDYWATVILNGTTIIDNVLIEGITGGALDSDESEPGPIMLQGDHGPIQYRNIVLTTLAN